MISVVLRVLVGLLVAYAVIALVAWRFQDRIAFPAPTAPLPTPAAVGIPDGEVISVQAADGVTLRGWYLPPVPPPQPGERAAGLVWFYGNMETIAGIAPVLRTFRPPAIGMLVLDYRGYGESAGRPSERGVYRDADAAWASLAARPEIDSGRIAVYGRSIGSAVALYVATTHPVRAVVLESPFTSGRAMAKQHYALLPSSLVRLSLDNLARARALSQPLLVVHGSEDWIAPIAMGRQVAEVGRAEEFMVIEGAGHNETFALGGERYRDRVWRFLEEHLK